MAWTQCPDCKGTGTKVVVPATPLTNEQVIPCEPCNGTGYIQDWKDEKK